MDGWTDIGTLRGPRGPKNCPFNCSYIKIASKLIPGEYEPKEANVKGGDQLLIIY